MFLRLIYFICAQSRHTTPTLPTARKAPRNPSHFSSPSFEARRLPWRLYRVGLRVADPQELCLLGSAPRTKFIRLDGARVRRLLDSDVSPNWSLVRMQDGVLDGHRGLPRARRRPRPRGGAHVTRPAAPCQTAKSGNHRSVCEQPGPCSNTCMFKILALMFKILAVNSQDQCECQL